MDALMERATSAQQTPRKARRLPRFVGAAAIAAWLVVMALVLRRVAVDDGVGGWRLVTVGAVLVAAYVGVVIVASLMAGGPPRRIGARVFLAVASAALVLGVLELPAFAFGYDWRKLIARRDELFVGRTKAWKNPWNVPDDELIFRRPANLVIQGETQGDSVGWLGIAHRTSYPFDLHYDANGYRNAKTPEHATVAVLGDSFVEAALVPIGEIVTTRLEQQLAAPVANLGVGGYGPQQELVVLRRHALPLAPKVVFWCFFEGNDLIDASRFDRDLRGDDIYKVDYWKRGFSSNVVSRVIGMVAAPRVEDGVEARRSSGTLRPTGRDHGTKIYFAYPHRGLSAEDVRTVDAVAGVFEEAQRACVERGAALVVVFVPEKFRVYGEQCDFPPESHCVNWKPSDLPQQLGERAKQAGIAFHDLTPALQRCAASGELVYFTDDGHWNPQGHEVVARELGQVARERLGAAR